MARVMAQNIYDNPEFFAGYSQLPRQIHGLDGAPEWPAIRAMLPDPAALRLSRASASRGKKRVAWTEIGA